MTDVVDKLTGVALQLEKEKFHAFYTIGREAIDEIKKLRARIALLEHEVELQRQMAREAEAKIDRMREALINDLDLADDLDPARPE